MVICRNYHYGNCNLGSKCRNDHFDLLYEVADELKVFLNSNQWKLTCFGPFSNRKCIPELSEDLSFEEVRIMYLNAKMEDNVKRHEKDIEYKINNTTFSMRMIRFENRQNLDILYEIYTGSTEAITKNIEPSNSTETASLNLLSASSKTERLHKFYNTTASVCQPNANIRSVSPDNNDNFQISTLDGLLKAMNLQFVRLYARMEKNKVELNGKLDAISSEINILKKDLRAGQLTINGMYQKLGTAKRTKNMLPALRLKNAGKLWQMHYRWYTRKY